ncbi:MAG: ABC transporter ATP-binding protein [Endozoicomonadaceae bacterium]|nr:ABC transporter ATP-binding protein [Endozoicomonadaceae bacterium]
MNSNHLTELNEAPRIRCKGITKHYFGMTANDDITLAVQSGGIHALLGENGAGKSTLMKIFSGVIQPDRGRIWWNGDPVALRSPVHARELGIGMISQHFSLFETLTVLQNIALSLGRRRTGKLKTLARCISDTAERYDMSIDPQRHIHTLSAGERQRVEMIRCLIQGARLIILDEPTSALIPSEVNKLFTVLRRLSSEGYSILFISHKLNEVQTLCHTVTILKRGRVTGHCNPKATPPQVMTKMMKGVNARLHTRYPTNINQASTLKVNQLTESAGHRFGTALKNIHFSAQQGEILAIAGIAGNGQNELLSLLSGERLASKTINLLLNEEPIGHWSPDQRREKGVCVVPEERLERSVVPDMDLQDNALLTGFLQNTIKYGFIQKRQVASFARRIIDDFAVKTSSSAIAKSLSDSNLQKFIIGREILQKPKVLICAHPTKGVDMAATNIIHEALIALRDTGTSIIVISDDLDELFQISDRIGALYNGHLSPIKLTSAVSIDDLDRWMAGLLTLIDGREPIKAAITSSRSEEVCS